MAGFFLRGRAKLLPCGSKSVTRGRSMCSDSEQIVVSNTALNFNHLGTDIEVLLQAIFEDFAP